MLPKRGRRLLQAREGRKITVQGWVAKGIFFPTHAAVVVSAMRNGSSDAEL